MSAASNDVYMQDKMSRNSMDFEGSGIGDGRFDEKSDRAERRKAARLPFVFLIFIVICLAMNVYMSACELYYYINGHTAVGQYTANKDQATWTAPDGSKKYVSTAWASQAGDTINVYYIGDQYGSAKVMSGWKTWGGFYGFFGGLLALDIFWLYRIFHRTKHSAMKN